MKIPIRAWLPFLGWFPVSSVQVRADLLAGLTVALVLIPQSMAYAQLAGLPSYYGLYAAFLPVMVGALWGSSRQLSTGPVAIALFLRRRMWPRADIHKTLPPARVFRSKEQALKALLEQYG